MARKNHARARRKLRQQGNSLASECLRSASDLREALRPIVAFRGKLEQAVTEEQLQLLVIEENLPDKIMHALDIHQILLTSLALSARAQPTEEQQQTERDLIVAEKATEPEVFVAREADL